LLKRKSSPVRLEQVHHAGFECRLFFAHEEILRTSRLRLNCSQIGARTRWKEN
jgi:hypothetical protein